MSFVSDSFTDTNATALGSHTGEIGATWTENPGALGVDPTIVSNQLVAGNSAGNIWYASGTPATSEYDVQFTSKFSSEASSGVGPLGRQVTTEATGYLAWCSASIVLYRMNAGSFTSLGSYAGSLVSGTVVKLQIRTAAKKVFIDGVERISSADDTITAAGKAGFRTYYGGGTTGIFDDFVANDVAGGNVNYSLTCAVGVYTYTGQTVALAVKHSLTCAAGSYSYTGVGAALTVKHNLVCATGTYTYSGISATLSVKRSLTCAVGSYAYSGIAAALAVKHSLVCASGGYSYAGLAATLSVKHRLTCAVGTYAYSGVTSTLTYIPGAGTVSYVLTCATGAYTYAGQSTTLSVKHRLTCAAGSYAYSGVSASLRIVHKLTCGIGAYTYTGLAATLSVKHRLTCAIGTYDYIGNTATLNYLSGTASISYALICAVGAYAYLGQSAVLLVVGANPWLGDTFLRSSPIRMSVTFNSSI